MDFALQVHRVYSLPEIFSNFNKSGSYDTQQYHKVHGYSTQGGKPNPRELAQDELKEIVKKKKSPPKINIKDLLALKAEEDRIATEQKENEEKEKVLQDLLNKMTPEEQYNYLKEIRINEPWLSWPEGKSISRVKKVEKNPLYLKKI